MKTDQSRSVKPWEGDWENRINQRIHERGFDTYLAYLSARPGQSYSELAAELGRDVAPVQVEWLHAKNTEAGNRREAILDSFVRHLHGALKKGWGLDKYWDSKVIGALANWQVTWDSGPELDAFKKQIFLMSPEPGWIPKDSADPILSEAAKRAWPQPLEKA